MYLDFNVEFREELMEDWAHDYMITLLLMQLYWCLIEKVDAMSFSYSLDKLCSHFYHIMLKLDKPHASTKCIVLWISPASTQCTYGAVVKLFCRFPSCEWLPHSSCRIRQSWWMVEITLSLCRWCLMGKNIIIASYYLISPRCILTLNLRKTW